MKAELKTGRATDKWRKKTVPGRKSNLSRRWQKIKTWRMDCSQTWVKDREGFESDIFFDGGAIPSRDGWEKTNTGRRN